MSSTPLPLKVSTPVNSNSTPGSPKSNAVSPPAAASTPPTSAGPTSGGVALKASDISSPHELTAFVETLLDQLDAKFDAMSVQMMERMTQMSSRVDALEASLQDIINTDVAPSVPQSPTPFGIFGSNGPRSGGGF